MPDLPTITVTGAQATRILAAFESVPNYKEELRQWVVDRVQQYELRQLDEENNVKKRDRATQIQSALPAAPPPE
jgi:hypothetical protein